MMYIGESGFLSGQYFDFTSRSGLFDIYCLNHYAFMSFELVSWHGKSRDGDGS